MKQGIHFWLPSAIAICCLVASSPAIAQVLPDATLPNNSSVASEGQTNTINGGTRAGSNLFHSFEQFSVPTGGEAYFNNAGDVQNIIGRVTGGSASNIDGLIRVNGTANLFLINPNGIVFGSNASLNIGGSFIGSTANSINFADGFQFKATAAQSAPLLTISIPIGLQFGTNPGKIQVQGNGQGISNAFDRYHTTFELIDTKFGLRVQPNQTLAFVGGDISLEGATLKTAGGRIELGSVGDNSLVSLTPINKGFSLDYDAVQNFGNIQLSQQAAVDASGAGSGDIQVWGRRVILTNGSQIEASTLGAEQGGNIAINAQDSVQVIGVYIDSQFPSSLIARVYSNATGATGGLTINSRELLVQDGAKVSTETVGRGNGGNLTVNAGSVQVINGFLTTATWSETRGSAGNVVLNTRELLLQNYSSITSNSYSEGKAGDITINTSKLKLEDGGIVSTATWASGNGGDLTINADSVQVKGIDPEFNLFHSYLNTSASFPTTTGAAGNLSINTRELLVRDGGRVSAGTNGLGNGGNLTINAQDVQLIGTSADGQFRSGLYASAQPKSTGDAGDLTVKTNNLLVRDGATVTAQSFGTGSAGSMTLNARSIHLDNNALLSADTRSTKVDPNSQQAIININSKDLIMSRNSNIFANATGENVIGGNINIGTDFLIASENSDISANSANFRGGNARINASGIFGTQFRNTPSDRTSDITATGASPEFSGTVQINTLDIDPNRGLVNLPAVPIDTSVAQSCTPGSSQTQSEFVVTGRGGLPPNPGDALSTDAVQVDWITLNPEAARSSAQVVSTSPTSPTLSPITEATGWVIGKNGSIVLTATAPNGTPHNPWITPTSCHTSKTAY